MAAHKGKYTPKNPAKYKGNPKNIIFRSGLELRLMRYLDNHPSILSWASEEPMCVIPYLSPLDNRVHRYFCDFFVEMLLRDKTVRKRLIEVKPKVQCQAPAKPKKKTVKGTQRYLRECKTFVINTAKWEAAKKACDQRGWDWLIITDDILTW